MEYQKRALICGIGGQDGSYLAKLLLDKEYLVYGTSRESQGKFLNLEALGILEKVALLDMEPMNKSSVTKVLEISNPDELYYLAGQSSVGRSFIDPRETIDSFLTGTLNVLEACRAIDKGIRIYHAGSSEAFGDTQSQFADESFPFRPKSPYGVAKAAACWLVDNYRESYDLFACSGILFNHESPLRPEHFVTQKIVSAIRRISQGSEEILTLGMLDIERDWGWAPEYVEAMWLMLQLENPENFVIATGETNSLKEFVRLAFSEKGMDWESHVQLSHDLHRPSDLKTSNANPTKAREVLGWNSRTNFASVVSKLVSGELY